MTRHIVIDPITRIEGHLKIEAVVDDGVVKEAKSSGMLWRGIEKILQGRDPLDAQRITQRICGVCPAGHSIASSLNLDSAFGVDDKIPDNGRIIRNLILGANYLQSHILHFYHLAALDFVDVTAVADYAGTDPHLCQVRSFISHGSLAPFVPRYEGDYRLTKKANIEATRHYVEALNLRRQCQELLSIFGGHMPHNVCVIPGGATETVTVDKIADFHWRLHKVQHFIKHIYIPDVLAVAGIYSDYFGIGGGCGNYLTYGSFDLDSEPDLTKRRRFFPQGRTSAKDLKPRPFDPAKIAEHVTHSRYSSDTKLHPSKGQTVPDHKKKDAYSWLKSPRYDDEVHEVGPLARQINAYVRGEEPTVKMVNDVLGHFKAGPEALVSVLGRHAARAIEAKMLADQMQEWLLEMKPGEPVHTPFEIPEESQGMGLAEAARGALGHWISIKDKVIASYQCIVPTTWNGSPRDDNGVPGPMEQALEGTRVKDPDNPFELVRIVRSFDPCIACAVHVVNAKGREMNKFAIG